MRNSSRDKTQLKGAGEKRLQCDPRSELRKRGSWSKQGEDNGWDETKNKNKKSMTGHTLLRTQAGTRAWFRVSVPASTFWGTNFSHLEQMMI